MLFVQIAQGLTLKIPYFVSVAVIAFHLHSEGKPVRTQHYLRYRRKTPARRISRHNRNLELRPRMLFRMQALLIQLHHHLNILLAPTHPRMRPVTHLTYHHSRVSFLPHLLLHSGQLHLWLRLRQRHSLAPCKASVRSDALSPVTEHSSCITPGCSQETTRRQWPSGIKFKQKLCSARLPR